jgi:hypothetical protein
MLKTTYLTRERDGLLLFESIETTLNDPGLVNLQNKALQLIKNIYEVTQSNASIEVGDHFLHVKKKEGVIFLVIAESHYSQ